MTNVEMLSRREFRDIMGRLFIYAQCQDDRVLGEIYYTYLSDVAPGHLKDAVDRFIAISTNRFLPSIGQLRELCNQCRSGRRWHWQEAWSIIMQATEIWSQHDREKAERAWQLVGEDLRPYVKNLGGFLNLVDADMKTLSVLQSNFRAAWEQSEADRREQQRLPASMQIPQAIVQQTAASLSLPKGV